MMIPAALAGRLHGCPAVAGRRLPCVALLLALLVATAARLHAEEGEFTVVAYNVENLFDIDGVALFDDYRSEHYGPRHLLRKLANTSGVLAAVSGDAGPDIILLQELEADQTPSHAPADYAALQQRYADTTVEAMLSEPVAGEVRDLPAEFFLLKALHDAALGPYQIAVGENRRGPGGRPIAHVNATLSRFPIVQSRTHHSDGARGTLEVLHDIGGHRLYTLNNHWKSGASDRQTEPTRIGNARVVRQRLDEILQGDPSADILLGGDFNSHHNQSQRLADWPTTAVNDVLGSQGDELAIRQPGGPDLYNLWYELPISRRGSDVYRGRWGTLMQMMITTGLYDHRGVQYVDNSFEVLALPGRNAQLGSGVPIAWQFLGDDGAGYSDHLPIRARFRVVDDDQTERFMQLADPSQGRSSRTARPVDYQAVKRADVPRALELDRDEAVRVAEHVGHVFLVEATVSGERPFRVRLFQQDYTVWAFDIDLRRTIYRRFPLGQPMHFYGELGMHRGQWQFVVRDPSWLRP